MDKDKVKKFVLPRIYFRKTTNILLEDDIEDNLKQDDPLLAPLTVLSSDGNNAIDAIDAIDANHDINNNNENLALHRMASLPDDKIAKIFITKTKKKTSRATKVDSQVETPNSLQTPVDEKATKRKPSKYNIFVKEKLIILNKTHAHMTAKERFTLAIMMWGDEKVQNAT